MATHRPCVSDALCQQVARLLLGTVGVVTRLTTVTALRLGKMLTQHADQPGRFFRATLGREPVTAWVVHATDDEGEPESGADPFDGDGRGAGAASHSPSSEIRASVIALMAEGGDDLPPLTEDAAWDLLHKQIGAIRCGGAAASSARVRCHV